MKVVIVDERNDLTFIELPALGEKSKRKPIRKGPYNSYLSSIKQSLRERITENVRGKCEIRDSDLTLCFNHFCKFSWLQSVLTGWLNLDKQTKPICKSEYVSPVLSSVTFRKNWNSKTTPLKYIKIIEK